MTDFIFMGVAGCGKSTIGQAVSQQLGLPFIEADDFHPAENIDKMSRGVALTDRDRGPWIDSLIAHAHKIARQTRQPHSIMACSGLSDFVRERLRHGLSSAPEFIHLSGTPELLRARLEARSDHFFDPALLSSQFAALRRPQNALTLDIANSVDWLVTQASAHIHARISKS